jgi:hypothetical protein
MKKRYAEMIKIWEECMQLFRMPAKASERLYVYIKIKNNR